MPLRPGRRSGEGWAHGAGSAGQDKMLHLRLPWSLPDSAAHPLLRDAAACACWWGNSSLPLTSRLQ